MGTRPTYSAPLVTSLAALALLAVALFMTVPPLLAAVFGGGARGVDPAKAIVALVEEHDRLMVDYQARFNGRSVFFRPPAPVRPTPTPPAVPVERPIVTPPQRQEPQGPPPPPATYQGPPVIAVLGDRVLFRGAGARDAGQWIAVGEEVNGLKVLESNAPRSVRVAHQRGEYDVPLFNWDMPFFRDASEKGQPIPGLSNIPVTASTSSSSARTQPAQPAPARDRTRAVATPPAATFEPPVDDAEAARQRADEQGVDLPDGHGVDHVDDMHFHQGGEPDQPEFDPDFDPDAEPEEEVTDEAENDKQDDPDGQEQDEEPENASSM